MFQQIGHDLRCRLTEGIFQDACNANVGNRHAVLDAVLLRGFHAYQLKTVSCDFPELPEIFRRDEGAPDQIKLVKVGNPFGILFICFFAFDGFDIFRMRKADIYVIFKIIKNRNPILASGFHANVITMIPDKPVVKLLDIRVDG